MSVRFSFRFPLPAWLLSALLAVPVFGWAQVCEVLQTRIPADIPLTNAEASASAFQQFGWDSFLGLNAPEPGSAPATGPTKAMWSDWSTSIDMHTCASAPDEHRPMGCECADGDCGKPGSRYYPTACRGIADYQQYRAIGQLAQIDDSFLQATNQGLSNDPAIDRNGRFLRYEILLSPATYSNIVEERLWDHEHLAGLQQAPTLGCGLPSYVGGDPAHENMGSIVLKAAWMDLGEAGASALSTGHYTEDLLIYTPAYRNATGIESCELRTMALAGFHIMHKTARQPAWIWSTFEHRDFAPNCTDEMPPPIPGEGGANLSCPTDADVSEAACNTAPVSNDPDEQCRNPTTPDLPGWCLDQPPSAIAGKSNLCRQVPVLTPLISETGAPIPDPLPDNYPWAAAWNQACVNALASNNLAPWTNYFMVSSQWTSGDVVPPLPGQPGPQDCANIVGEMFDGVVNAKAILPGITDQRGISKPFLGNTTMESYQRSNCLGCHSMSSVANTRGGETNTDFLYFLSLKGADRQSNDMAYQAIEKGGFCAMPAGTPMVEFQLQGGAIGNVKPGQAFDLLVAIEIPGSIRAVAPLSLDPEHPPLPWMFNGERVGFMMDSDCRPGVCTADQLFPSPEGRHWVQYRSTVQFTVTPDQPAFSGLLWFQFPGADCADFAGADFRVWAGDDSQRRYANFVDSAFIAGSVDSLPPRGVSQSPPRGVNSIPALRPVLLPVLVLLLLLTGHARFRGKMGRQ